MSAVYTTVSYRLFPCTVRG